MTTHTEKSERPAPTDSDRRRGNRVSLSFQVEIAGFDSTGTFFHDQTVTTDVSEHGCRFDLLHELQCGDVLLLRLSSRQGGCRETSKPIAFEVAWVVPSAMGWSVGVAKLQHTDLWHMRFPATAPNKTTL